MLYQCPKLFLFRFNPLSSLPCFSPSISVLGGSYLHSVTPTGMLVLVISKVSATSLMECFPEQNDFPYYLSSDTAKQMALYF